MQSLKNSFISPPALAFFSAANHFTFDVDPCDIHIGCVLYREQPDKTVKTKRYLSRLLANPKRRYYTTQKEFLFIVWAVFLLRPYSKNRRSALTTDHDSLKGIPNPPDSSKRLAHWRLRLPQYEFSVDQRAEIKHKAADPLSRLQMTGEGRRPLENNLSNIQLM